MFLAKIPCLGSTPSKTASVLVCRSFSMNLIGERVPKEQHFDYMHKPFPQKWITQSTYEKLQENTLLITVEGNFGSGKTKFAQQLGKRIDFDVCSKPDLDRHLYEMPNGHNLRQVVNAIAGDNRKFRADSLEEWHLDPTFKRAIFLQDKLYQIKFRQYRFALIHMLSTARGVILERSLYSDSVIAKALHSMDFFSNEAFNFYSTDLLPNSINEMKRPHVVIYLDRSPADCLKNIQKNGKDFEKKSNVYSLDLLNKVDQIYKKEFLPKIGSHTYVLQYNSDDVDVENVAEDLEAINYDAKDMLKDWRMFTERTLHEFLTELSHPKFCEYFLEVCPRGRVSIPEYLLFGDDNHAFVRQLEESGKLLSLQQEKSYGLKGLFPFLGEKVPIERSYF